MIVEARDKRPARWGRLVVAGLASGAVVNLCEWAAHHWWLDRAWTEAFAVLGKVPTGWTTFIPSNFWLGILAVWGYRWFGGFYGFGLRTAVRTACAVWLVFWVIPTLAMAPLELFPNRLLALTIMVGAVDGVAATVLGAWLYEGMRWPSRSRP